jgi:hypothetical protein
VGRPRKYATVEDYKKHRREKARAERLRIKKLKQLLSAMSPKIQDLLK